LIIITFSIFISENSLYFYSGIMKKLVYTILAVLYFGLASATAMNFQNSGGPSSGLTTVYPGSPHSRYIVYCIVKSVNEKNGINQISHPEISGFCKHLYYPSEIITPVSFIALSGKFMKRQATAQIFNSWLKNEANTPTLHPPISLQIPIYLRNCNFRI
jgi:hypothetical protein